MGQESSAQRYAQALFDMARDAGAEARIFENAGDFLRVFEGSPELRTALSHPNIQREDRLRVLDAVLAGSGYDRMFANFLRVLVGRGRFLLYAKIVHSYGIMRDDAAGRIRAQVYAAQPLSASQRAALKAKVESQLGHEIVLQERLEPSILGGFRLEVGGRVYDSSIRRHLERLRDSLHTDG